MESHELPEEFSVPGNCVTALLPGRLLLRSQEPALVRVRAGYVAGVTTTWVARAEIRPKRAGLFVHVSQGFLMQLEFFHGDLNS